VSLHFLLNQGNYFTGPRFKHKICSKLIKNLYKIEEKENILLRRFILKVLKQNGCGQRQEDRRQNRGEEGGR
jgi:hypothetical protein